jgi:hypothetical protein
MRRLQANTRRNTRSALRVTRVNRSRSRNRNITKNPNNIPNNWGFNTSIHATSETRNNWKNGGKWAFYRKFSDTYKNIPPTGIIGVYKSAANANYNYGGYAFKGKPTLFSRNYNSEPWKEEIPEGEEGMYVEHGHKPIAVKCLGKENGKYVFERV